MADEAERGAPAGPGGKLGSRKWLLKAILLVAVLGLVINMAVAFFSGFDTVATLGALAAGGPALLLVPFALYFCNYFIDSLRYKLLFGQFGYRIPLPAAVYDNMMGVFFSNLTPMAAGGQPYQVWHLQRIGVDSKSATNIIVSRYIEYMGTTLVLVAAVLPKAVGLIARMSAGAVVMSAGIAVTILVTLAIALAYFWPARIGRIALWFSGRALGRFISRVAKKDDWASAIDSWSRELHANVRLLWKERLPAMLLDVALGFAALAVQALSLYLVIWMRTPNLPVTPWDIMVAFVLINLVVYYVPTPGASGGIEAMYTIIFGELIGDVATAAGCVLIWRFATYYLHILVGAGWFFAAGAGPGAGGLRGRLARLAFRPARRKDAS